MKELMLKRKGVLFCCAMVLATAAFVGVGVAQANAADLKAVENETPAAVAVDDKKADAVDEAAVDEGAFEGEAEQPSGEDAASAGKQELDAVATSEGDEVVELMAGERSEGIDAMAVEMPADGMAEPVDEAQSERVDEEPPELEECPASALD